MKKGVCGTDIFLLARNVMDRIQEINMILAEADPLDLISCGAPPDEYIAEAASLTELEKQSPISRDTIRKVFEMWFGKDSPFANGMNQKKLEAIAKKIKDTVS